MIKKSVLCFMALILASCEHSGYDVTKFSGEYKNYADIAEFFDCDSGIKYYVADAGIHKELQDMYSKLNLEEKDDVYITIEGYTREEEQMEGIDPITKFVPVELLSHDVDRGCELARRPMY